MKIVTAITLLVLATVAGCERQRDALVVNVALPAGGTAARIVGRRLLDFAASKPRISSGRRIVVQEIYPRGEEFAQLVAANPSVDIVICDSPEELAAAPALQQGLANSINACGTEARCPAFIAQTVPPERRQAVQQVFRAIASEATR